MLQIDKAAERIFDLFDIETFFVKEFDSTCHRISLAQLLFDKIKHVSPYKCCDNSDSNAILALYIRIRIFVMLKLLHSLFT